MLKRVFWVALFTGLSHFISIVTISYVLRNLGEETSGYLGIIDSTVILVASIISFGIQLAVNRNVATRKSWKSNYKLGQSARLMLSSLVMLFGLGTYLIQGNLELLIYCIAPLVALNGDYALYGNGKPIVAASLSFLRVALPNLGIVIVAHFFGIDVLPIYILLLALAMLAVGLISAYYNGVSYFYLPRKNFLKFYFKYSKVGVYQMAGVLLVPGILVIANWFYTISIIGLINGLLKLLIVYKGGLRIIVQSFFKEIKFEGISTKIDKVSLLAWGAISVPVIIFYDTTLSLLFKNTYNDIELILPFIGAIMFLSAFRNSAEAKALIDRKDNLNMYAFLIALTAEVIVIILFSFSEFDIWGIPVGFFVGEIILVIWLGFGTNKKQFFVDRLLFVAKFSPVLIVILLIRIELGSNIYTLISCLILFIIWILLFNRKLIFDSLTRGSPEK